MENNKLGIYVHIPFCERKCIYCDFLSFSTEMYGEAGIQKYFDTLTLEAKKKKENINNKVKSLFIGGGTPSIVDAKYIYNLIVKLKEIFTFSKDAELSIEVNPGTVDKDDFKIYKEAGINRISFGVQSLDKDLLKFLRRIHTREDAIKAILNAQEAGIENINADILMGIPNQSLDSFMSTLDELTRLGLTHISAYSLILEEDTVLYTLIDKGLVKMPEEELDRDMYHNCTEFLKNRGYEHYEISNFAKPGYECKHNFLYWDCDEYIGLGLGASSYLNSVRFKNTSDMPSYLNQNFSQIEPEHLDEIDKMNEFMLLGFRLKRGPSAELFYNRFKKYYHIEFKDTLDKLMDRGLVYKKGEREDFVSYCLTEKGFDLANQVFMEFV